MAVWIYRFPTTTINHCVLIYDSIALENSFEYLAYDPNTPDRPLKIIFNTANRSFSCEKTFYFSGGPIFLRHVYLSPFQ